MCSSFKLYSWTLSQCVWGDPQTSNNSQIPAGYPLTLSVLQDWPLPHIGLQSQAQRVIRLYFLPTGDKSERVGLITTQGLGHCLGSWTQFKLCVLEGSLMQQHKAIFRYHQDVWEFNSILTLSAQHLIPQIKGSVPQHCPPPLPLQTPVSSPGVSDWVATGWRLQWPPEV